MSLKAMEILDKYLDTIIPSGLTAGMTYRERYFAQIAQGTKVVNGVCCRLWIGKLYSNGYGGFDIKGNTILAHRAAIIISGRSLGDNEVARHDCDVRNCVEPPHLKVGTQKDNMLDAKLRGRANVAWGDNAGLVKIPDKELPKIVKLRKQGLLLREIGAIYGVNGNQIGRILNGKRRQRSMEIAAKLLSRQARGTLQGKGDNR